MFFNGKRNVLSEEVIEIYIKSTEYVSFETNPAIV